MFARHVLVCMLPRRLASSSRAPARAEIPAPPRRLPPDRPHTLQVQEFAQQGYWVPGGCTDPNESLTASAVRECLEEGGVRVELKGLVEVRLHGMGSPPGNIAGESVCARVAARARGGGWAWCGVPGDSTGAASRGCTWTLVDVDVDVPSVHLPRPGAQRSCCMLGPLQVSYTLDGQSGEPTWRLVTFYAEAPAEEEEVAGGHAKTVPDFESAGACWVGVDDLGDIPHRSERIPKTWFPYFAKGGKPKPLELPADVAHLFKGIEF